MKPYKILTIIGITAAITTSCSQVDTYDEVWTPGEPSDAPGLFFPGTENLLSVSIGLDPVVELKVSRIAAGNELTVPLIVECEDAAVSVPQTVTIPSNETEASVQIRLDGLEPRKLTPIKVTFPDEYLNPYAGGRAVFSGNVIVSEWDKINGDKGVTFSYLDWSYKPYTVIDPIVSTMYNLVGTDRYRIENFMNSGLDFSFELKESPYESWKGYYRIMPMCYQAFTKDYNYNSWYNDWWFADEEDENWPEYNLTSNGQPLIFYGTTYYWYDDSTSSEYCFVRKQGTEDASGNIASYNEAWMGCFAYTNEEWTRWSPYLRLNFTWKDIK